MIWTLVIFGITLFILKRYVFGPVGAAIEKRRADISREHRGGRARRDEATALLEDYRTRLAEARKEADRCASRAARRASSRVRSSWARPRRSAIAC